MKKILFSAFTLAILLTSACKDPEVTMFDCASTPTYTADIKTILDASCATSGCHDVTTKADGIDLSAYATANTESKKSKFLGSIQHLDTYTPMPLGGAKLGDADIEALSCWVQGGSPE